ncbi:retrovirus-related Pol polyprotein from transposon TNT 1-94 [Trifolium pratense]|uniref:Retrovirus-related Pol polyprotein from transposon TNT 1-94 n=3 Tax=Trifolium pratense TaxID=57577 RepID=A0A2K3MRX4_TRIPR|nr:retrovirus-related Pol polyprotein from transposon TNT 1-94 [Trifolium pratense]
MSDNEKSSAATNKAGKTAHTGDGVVIRKTISPYDITSNDNPGSLITHVQLKGENYDEWASSIRTALRARKKFGFVDGTIGRPGEESSDLEDWWTNNSLLVSWIMNTIEPSLRSTMSHMEVAMDLWNDIKERFSIANGPRIQQLKAELVECKQKGLTIVTYYGKLKKLWEELVNYDQILTCKCGLCTCNLGNQITKKREEEKIHQFLMGLDDTLYGTVRSNLLAQDPLPTLNKVYATLVQEERLRMVTRVTEERGEAMAFAVHSKFKNKEKEESCSHCNQVGHNSEGCFQLIGYPEWWGDRRRRPMKGSGRGKPEQSNNRNRGGTAKAHVAQAKEITAEVSAADFGLTSDQLQTLSSLLNNVKLGSIEKLNGKCSFLPWIIDTGASHHMTGQLECLTNIRNIFECSIGLPNGEETVATKEGNVVLNERLQLKNVLYVPSLQCNLISVSQLLKNSNYVVQFTDKFCLVQDPTLRTPIGAGEQREGLYYLRGMVKAAAMKTNKEVSFDLLHQRLGHASLKVLQMLPNVRPSSKNNSCTQTCEICLRAKQSRDNFPVSENKAATPFHLIHCDLWGPYRNATFCGAKYFLTIVDDFSRAVWIYLLIDKTEVSKHLYQFLAMVERQFSAQVKIIRSDNGTEFTCMKQNFRDCGIIHETSCVGTPQQNGRVERKHRHILNVARALRFQAQLPIEFWGECALAACYLINRTPTKTLSGKTPYELLYGKAPSLEHLRVVGCLAYAHNQHHKGDKFATRSRKCVFVGYPYGTKGWRMYDLELGIFFNSRDVVFCENEFPFAAAIKTSQLPSDVQASFSLNNNIEDDSFQYVSNIDEFPSTQVVETRMTNGHDELVDTQTDLTNMSHDVGSSVVELDDTLPVAEEIAEPTITDNIENLGRGHRIKFPSTKLHGYVRNTISKIFLSDCSTAPTCPVGTLYPLSQYVNYANFSPRHRNFLAAITAATEPQSFAEAVKDVRWRNAMQLEIEALEKNGTWIVETLPPNKKAIGSKWVYRIKYHSDGTIERYKARLVILGNNQVEGLDYHETFAPVVKMVTVRTFLAVAAAKCWELHQMDVHNAFLHGDLDEEVYMKLPPGFRSSTPNQACRLRKSLYGLKQAPRCWFAKLKSALLRYGFTQSYSDYSLFTLHRDSAELYVLVYVDDLIISGNDNKSIESFKSYLSTCFHMKDLGTLKYFLGIEVARNSNGIFLCQQKYTLDIIAEAGLLGSKPVGFPLEQNHHLPLATGTPLQNPDRYRRLVGRLVYLTVTRAELSYCVHMLAQFMHKPLEEHWNAAIRVVRYLKGNPGQGILLKAACDLQLYAWCDSDWAGCPLSRRSLTGWIVFLGNSPISWKTKKQNVVSRSSAEAEYRSMATTTCELKWLKALLLSLGVSHSLPMRIYCDSQSALHIAANPVFHERTKHIEVDCHFLRDELLKGNISTHHVSTKIQLADIFTKALGKQQFDYFLNKLGIHNLHAPT